MSSAVVGNDHTNSKEGDALLQTYDDRPHHLRPQPHAAESNQLWTGNRLPREPHVDPQLRIGDGGVGWRLTGYDAPWAADDLWLASLPPGMWNAEPTHVHNHGAS